MQAKSILPATIIILLYIIVFKPELHAQSKKNYLFIGVGRSHLQDVYLTAKSFKNRELGFGYSYHNQSIERISGFEVLMSKNRSEIDRAVINTNGIDLSLNDGFNIIKEKTFRTAIYFGYAFRINPMYSFSDNKSIDRFSWRSVNSFSFYHATSYRLNSGTILFETKIPLVACIYRPERSYSSDRGDHVNEILTSVYANPNPVSLTRYRAAEVNINYAFEFKKLIDLRPGIRYSIEKYSGLNGFESRSIKLHLNIGL